MTKPGVIRGGMKTLIVTLTLTSYRYLEESARAAGVTLPRHASELLEDLVGPVELPKKPAPKQKTELKLVPAKAGREHFMETPVKRAEKLSAEKLSVEKPKQQPGKLLRGLAVHTPEKRSEIAQRAAATRKRRAEEAARKSRRG
jgi:hypothetical protein